jgi:single-strand DNA-binding protein
MWNDFNKLVLSGRVATDPTSHKDGEGKTVCNFKLLVRKGWYDKTTGLPHKEISWIDCEAWGKTADAIVTHVRKGAPLLIDGRLAEDRWNDPEEKRRQTVVVVTGYQNIERYVHDPASAIGADEILDQEQNKP